MIWCFKCTYWGVQYLTHLFICYIIVVFQIKYNSLLFGQLKNCILQPDLCRFTVEPCTSFDSTCEMTVKVIKWNSTVFLPFINQWKGLIGGNGIKPCEEWTFIPEFSYAFPCINKCILQGIVSILMYYDEPSYMPIQPYTVFFNKEPEPFVPVKLQ